MWHIKYRRPIDQDEGVTATGIPLCVMIAADKLHPEMKEHKDVTDESTASNATVEKM